jgi:hypothetical protein
MTTPARRTTTRSTTTRSSTPRPHRSGTLRTGTVRTGTLRSTPVRPHLWVVPDGEAPRRPRSEGRRRAPFVLLVVALLLGTTLGLLFLNTAIAVDSLKATQLRTENAQREQDIQRLEQQVVNGSTPEQLADEAAKAGLVPAGPPAYLVIQPDGSSTVRGTPEPAPQPVAPPAGSPAPSSPAGAVPGAGG